MFIPQAASTWQARKNPMKLQGISAGTQWLIVLNATLWGILGVKLNSFAVAAPGIVNAPLALFTLFLIYQARRIIKNNPDKFAVVEELTEVEKPLLCPHCQNHLEKA